MVAVFFTCDAFRENSPLMDRVLVSYAYYEKSTERHHDNLKFFLQEGVTRLSDGAKHVRIELNINGLCKVPLPETTDTFQAFVRPNVGYDFGAHTDTLERALQQYNAHRFEETPYRYFIFLNGGQRGPFLPTYWPQGRPWTDVFTSKLVDDVALVGASMFYHEKTQQPVVETWAFALRADGLQSVWDTGRVFLQHPTKHSACVAEDELTPVIRDAGFRFQSLLLKHSRPSAHTQHNKNLISSRPWQYEEINIHPLEVVFYKTYWDTAGEENNHFECPYEARYTQWLMEEPEYHRPILQLKSAWKAPPSPKATSEKKEPNTTSISVHLSNEHKAPPDSSVWKKPGVIVGLSVAATVFAAMLGLIIFLLVRKL